MATHSPLKQKALQAARWMTLGTGVSALLQIAQLAILSRLLLEAQMGLAATVNAFAMLGLLLADAGVSNAIVQRKNLTPSQLSSLYWLSIGLGAAVAGACWLAAGPIANFYTEPALAPLVHIVALGFLLMPLGQQFKALHQKHLEFRALTTNEMLSSVASAIVSIVLAVAFGLKAEALAWGFVVKCGVQGLLFWYTGRQHYRPQWHFRLQEARGFFSFGAYQLATAFANFIHSYLDTLIVGKLIGIPAAGLYDTAKNLVLRPFFILNPIITRVTLPVFALLQDDIPRLAKMYQRTLLVIALINLPLYALMCIAADPISRLLVGENWSDQIIWMVRVLSIYGALRSLINPAGSLMIGLGKVRPLFYWTVASALVNLLAVLAGAYWGGLPGITLLMTAFYAGWLVVLLLVYVCAPLQLTLRQVLPPLLLVGILALLAHLPGLLWVGLPAPHIVQLGSVGVVGGMLYLALLRIFYPAAWSTILEIVSELRQRKSASKV